MSSLFTLGSYMGGAPSRSNVTIKAMAAGTVLASASSQVATDVALFPVRVGPLNVPDGAGPIQLVAILTGSQTTDDITATISINVFAPPTFISVGVAPSGIGVLVKYHYDGTALTAGTRITLEKLNGYRDSEEVEKRGAGGDYQLLFPYLPAYVSDDVNSVRIEARLRNDLGQDVIADSTTESRDAVRIIASSVTGPIPVGFTPTIANRVNYSVGKTQAILVGLLEYTGYDATGKIFRVPASDEVVCASDLAPAMSNTVDCTIPANRPVPDGLDVEVTVHYRLSGFSGNLAFTSAVDSYHTTSRMTVPSTPGQNAQSSGVKLTTTSSTAGNDYGIDVLTNLSDIFSSKPKPADSSGGNSAKSARRDGPVAIQAPAVSGADLVGMAITWQFSPPIPDDGSFTAQMTLRYAPAAFPDIPGFQEQNLQIVSYDPETRKIVVYPSTVDTSAQTVTASIVGLAPSYSLVVPAASLGASVSLPLVVESSTLGLFNSGAQAARVSVIPHDASGNQLKEPMSVMVGPDQQVFGTLPDFTSLTSAESEWVQAQADSTGLLGAIVVADGKALEVLPVASSAVSLVLTGVELADGQSALLHLINTSAFDNSVSLELHDSSGTLADVFEARLAPKGKLFKSLRSLFAHISSPFQGYIIVNGSQRLSAAILNRLNSSMWALNAQPFDAGSPAATKLYAPHFATGGGSSTRINVLNFTAADATIVLRGFSDTGVAVGRPLNVKLTAGSQFWSDVGQALGLDGAKQATGWVQIDSSISGLQGDVLFGDVAGFQRASLPLIAAPAASSVIPHLLNTPDLAMTLYAANPGPSKAILKLTVLAPDASTIGTANLSIPASGRFSQALSQAVGAAAGQTGGAILIDSDQPLIALALIAPPSPVRDFAAIAAQKR